MVPASAGSTTKQNPFSRSASQRPEKPIAHSVGMRATRNATILHKEIQGAWILGVILGQYIQGLLLTGPGLIE
jgi:hypothetical protein